MLCPFCGKERRDYKRCPKCHKAQRQKWRGATESDYAYLFRPQEEIDISNDVVSAENILSIDKGIEESSRVTIFQVITNLGNWLKTNMHKQNE